MDFTVTLKYAKFQPQNLPLSGYIVRIQVNLKNKIAKNFPNNHPQSIKLSHTQ